MTTFLNHPTEDVPWEQVAAAVPEEAAAFDAALAEAEADLEQVCWMEECDLPDEVAAEWNRLSQQFIRATGLELTHYCKYRDEWDDHPEAGFRVIGAWQLSPAGKRFFGVNDEKEA